MAKIVVAAAVTVGAVVATVAVATTVESLCVVFLPGVSDQYTGKEIGPQLQQRTAQHQRTEVGHLVEGLLV